MTDLVFNRYNKAATDSVSIAELFGKNHYHVKRDIRDLISGEYLLKYEENAHSRWYYEETYEDSLNRSQEKYVLSEDAFTLLVMGYTGEPAMRAKIAFIDAFHAMRDTLKEIASNDAESAREAAQAALDGEEGRLLLNSKRPSHHIHRMAANLPLEEGAQKVLTSINGATVPKEKRERVLNSLMSYLKSRWKDFLQEVPTPSEVTKAVDDYNNARLIVTTKQRTVARKRATTAENKVSDLKDDRPFVPLFLNEHGFSINYMYEDLPNGRKRRKTGYNNWRARVDAFLNTTPLVNPGVDLTGKLEVNYIFGCMERFDGSNLVKSIEDAIADAFLDGDDNNIKKHTVTVEPVNSFAEGYIDIEIRNL